MKNAIKERVVSFKVGSFYLRLPLLEVSDKAAIEKAKAVLSSLAHNRKFEEVSEFEVISSEDD